jgi:hypothetical protein
MSVGIEEEIELNLGPRVGAKVSALKPKSTYVNKLLDFRNILYDKVREYIKNKEGKNPDAVFMNLFHSFLEEALEETNAYIYFIQSWEHYEWDITKLKLFKLSNLAAKDPETVQAFRDIASYFFKVPWEILISQSRKRELVTARQMLATWLDLNVKTWSLKSTGRFIGGRDHSTVIHAKGTMNDLLETDKFTRATWRELNNFISLYIYEESTSAIISP